MNQGYFADVGRCFKGPLAWVSWVVLLYSLVAAGLVVYLAMGLFDADTTRNQILFATGLVLSAFALMICKFWFFIQMTRRSLEERLDETEPS